MNNSKKTEYLQVCNEVEILSLDVSLAHKALNEKKHRLEKLEAKKKQLRHELVGLLEQSTPAPRPDPLLVQDPYKPRSFA
jgi:hypothetical protein